VPPLLSLRARSRSRSDRARCLVFVRCYCTYAVWCGRFFDMVEWGRMEARDYKPPMVPSLAHDLDLSFFDPTFTAEPPCVPTRLTGPHAVAHTRIRTRARAHTHTRRATPRHVNEEDILPWVHNPRRLILSTRILEANYEISV
jgi:hypothetical protein